MIGTVLGNRYRLDELIGEGGMALVYRAECSLLQRPVAVKVLRPQFASDAEFVERFRREAQAAGRLSHPSIVNVYDVGQDRGLNYIVMEYVQGENLKELIRREAPFTAARALDIARQICEALRHAHQNNIIHRDIKPHNILITPEGRVKVTDFGIARAVSASTLTQSGSVLGSVQYFSPEQAKGSPTGVASDLYSLGCVLYEMLTGTVPFKGESPIAIALKHLQEQPPPLRIHRPGLPPAVESLVARALAKDPTLRFPSAQAMLQAIQAALGQAPAAAPERDIELATQVMPAVKPPGTGARRPLLIFLAVLGMAALGTVLFFWWWLYLSPKTPVTVPRLVGLSIGEARQRARSADFRLHETWLYAEGAAGTVMRQDPEAGIRVKERSLKVWVSRGPEKVAVPDLTRMTPEEARTALEDLGLVYLEAGRQRSETVEEGFVAGQEPAAGETVSRGGTIRVYLSLGNKFVLEDFRGRPLGEVVARLAELEISYSVVNVNSVQPLGTVVEQWPAPGEAKPVGTIVQLEVSNGEEPPLELP
ncbi:MAG: Stk1 family PASTA domain-containing Ser/Thr kinase [Patescibacteria group bacterium]